MGTDMNVSLEILLAIFPLGVHLGWGMVVGNHLSVMHSILMLNLWTMDFTLNLEVFMHYHCCHYSFQEYKRKSNQYGRY